VRAFTAIARFEIEYYLKRLSTWVYFALFFALAFLIVNVLGGAFGTSFGNEKEFINSPTGIAGAIGSFAIFQLLITSAIFGHSAQRDYEVGIYPLFFAAPISKAGFLGGRFVGAAAINLFISTGATLGFLIGTWMPYLSREQFGPFVAAAYLQPYVMFVVPNLLFCGAIFFVLAALTRQMLANYVGSMVLLVGYFASHQFLAELDYKMLAALLDPFGFSALEEATRYWTVDDKNTLLLPFARELVLNRLLWLAIALVVLVVGYRLFCFSHTPAERKRKTRMPDASTPGLAGVRHLALPSVHRSFGAGATWAQLVSLTRSEFRGIVANVYFKAILLIGLLFLGVSAYNVGKIYGTTTYPVTYVVLDAIGADFWLLLMVLVVFQSGEMIWRDRQEKVSGLTDSMPVPTWVWFSSKLLALIGMMKLVMVMAMLFGILSQAARGYFNFELRLYVLELFVFSLVSMTLWCVFTLTIHAVANHKYVSHLLVIGFFMGVAYLSFLGFEHSIYRFNSGGIGMYSDMNGYGYRMPSFIVYKLYWGMAAVLLALLSNVLWVRGREDGWKQRVAVAQLRFAGPVRRLAAVASLGFIGLGGFVFYNTNVFNEYTTSKETRKLRAEYEKKYKQFEPVPQPRIAAVTVKADIFPERGALHLSGTYRLVNRTEVAIDSVHVLLPDSDFEVRRLAFDRTAEEVLVDRRLGYRILRLERPL
jgi:ABC-2 type transport system permease protein